MAKIDHEMEEKLPIDIQVLDSNSRTIQDRPEIIRVRGVAARNLFWFNRFNFNTGD